ncbi:MAG: diacylglycerol kinase family protein [Methylocystis sp.]
MKKRSAFPAPALLKSFSFAFAGLAFMLRTQRNARVHAIATAAVLGAGGSCQVDVLDWRWLIAAIAFVWVAEAMNTAIEHVCNAVSPQYQTGVEKAKDVAAGAVLLAAGGAALIEVSVFGPV